MGWTIYYREEPKSFFHDHFVTFVAGATCCVAAAFWACRRIKPQQKAVVPFLPPATLPPQPALPPKPIKNAQKGSAARTELQKAHALVRAGTPSAHAHAHGAPSPR